MKKITVLAADTERAMELDGAAIEMDFDTVAAAKQYAKHLLTEQYRIASESSTRLGYSQIVVNGVVAHDFFARETK